MHNYPTVFCDTFLAEIKRRLFEECLPRTRQCLEQLNEDQIWYRPNANANSVGNIVLHLCGNVRQWIGAGLGGQADIRERDLEFAEKGPIPRAVLLAKLATLEKEVEQVLAAVQPEDLLRKRKVQIYEESGLSILVHVVEHFSYHVGQLTYIVKMLKDVDTGYYAGQDL